LCPILKEYFMAKQQAFADKLKKKKKSDFISVKLVKAIKTDKGSYKFNEKFVKVDDLNKLALLK